MRRVEEPKLVEYPLPYKACHDYTMPLKDGDRLSFRAGDMDVGTFSVAGLPDRPALLLLVPHRKDGSTAAVAFQSHIFTESDSAQVAVVDAYRGTKTASIPLIQEKQQREELKFNTVVALAPGKYEVGLHWEDASAGPEGANSFAPLVARPQESYVMLRVGTGSKGQSEYPEGVVVFPQLSDSGAAGRSCLLGLLLAAVVHAAGGL